MGVFELQLSMELLQKLAEEKQNWQIENSAKARQQNMV